MWNNLNSDTLLAEVKNGTITLENWLFLIKVNIQKPYDPQFYTKRNENMKYMSTQTIGHKCPKQLYS